MPISGVPGGVQQASEVLKQVQKQVKPSGPGKPNFGQILSQKAGANPASQATLIQPTHLIEKLQKVPTAIRSLFNTWSRDSNGMNKIMKIAMSGQKFDPSQLLVLQNATYKISFELEAMSKLAEQASSAIKTTMQTQV